MPAPSSSDHDALPPGTRFGEFEIVRVLGVGGFGIVYLARDHSLERDVALKEYMPASLASRGDGPQITLRSSAFAETYAIGLRSFINEARLLARFDHPSLVKVYRFWEDNATAYMVMPYLQGITLRDARRGMTHPPDEAWIRSVVDPILSALDLLHRESVYHRDIAPDNILLPPGGPPVLLDFGAARRVISGRTQSFTAILKPSYAPIEQYAEMTQLRQGPWTDLYALGAVMHYLLFGVPPQPATARAVEDDGASIADRSVPGVSPRLLESVAWALAIRPHQRPQSVDDFRGGLDGRVAIPQLGRQSITLPGRLAPLVGAAATARADPSGPPRRAEPLSEGSNRLEASAAAAPPPIDGSPAATAAGGASFAPSLRPPVQVPPALAPGRRGDAAGRGAEANGEPTGPAAPAPATRIPAAVATPRGSTLGYVFAGLGVVAVAAGVAIWLFGLPADTVTASAPAAAPPASGAASTPRRSELAEARPVPAASAPLPETAVPAVAGPVVAVPAVVAMAPTASASMAGPAVRAEQPAAEASPPSGASKAASATPQALAASRPKPAPRKPEAGLPTVADSSSPHNPSGAAGRSGSAHEAQPVRPEPEAEPAGPTSARQACGGRVFLSRAICMDRECEQPRFRGTAECIPILERKRARENR